MKISAPDDLSMATEAELRRISDEAHRLHVLTEIELHGRNVSAASLAGRPRWAQVVANALEPKKRRVALVISFTVLALMVSAYIRGGHVP